MDYKYIEQLVERYWNGETSLEEEQILRAFFRQKEIPTSLLCYKVIFAYEDREKQKGLGDDFDAKILEKIEIPTIKAKRLTLRSRLMPLMKAAAMVAVVMLIGMIAEHSMDKQGESMIYVHDEYSETSSEPEVAVQQTAPEDSVKIMAVEDEEDISKEK
ncbi:hypothetical protein [Phocaeicola oris]|uniref:hypothetical protein n=1 Tax=Phocaeicola oris TaxID=2896850 RepID=UPI00234F9524|nr:hypothetical protein [Phocaeicola oris]MCE2616893.1 hypothetical protein [Phocaeicola oris]